jgi:hypothetical protein
MGRYLLRLGLLVIIILLGAICLGVAANVQKQSSAASMAPAKVESGTPGKKLRGDSRHLRFCQPNEKDVPSSDTKAAPGLGGVPTACST